MKNCPFLDLVFGGASIRKCRDGLHFSAPVSLSNKSTDEYISILRVVNLRDYPSESSESRLLRLSQHPVRVCFFGNGRRPSTSVFASFLTVSFHVDSQLLTLKLINKHDEAKSLLHFCSNRLILVFISQEMKENRDKEKR